jgi:hypothetical protein
MSVIGSVEMLVETGSADTSGRTPIGAVAAGWSLHAELTRAAATIGMAAKRAAREVRADMRRIANLLDGWQVDFVRGQPT